MIDFMTSASIKRQNPALFEIEGSFCPLDALVMARMALPVLPSVLGTTLDGRNELSIANQHDISVTIDEHKMTMECEGHDAPFLHSLSAVAGGRVCVDGVWHVSQADDAHYKTSQKRIEILDELDRPFPLAGGKAMVAALRSFHRLSFKETPEVSALLRQADDALTPFITFTHQQDKGRLPETIAKAVIARGFQVSSSLDRHSESGVIRVTKDGQSAHILVNVAQADDLGMDYIRHRPE